MNLNTIKTVALRKGHRGVFIVQKHSPIILTSVGIVGGATAAVLGAKATLKLEPILDELHDDLEIVKIHGNDVKEKSYTYTKAGIKISKLYAPAVSLGLASAVSIVGAQGIMQKRNVALVAAYSAVEKGFAEYRNRVEKELGEDKEREFRFGKTFEEQKELAGLTSEEKSVSQASPYDSSIYARFFDEGSRNWVRNPDYNKIFLKAQQQFANDLLNSRGYVFLNDVYDTLGIERTPAGQMVGWLAESKDSDGDGYIDFGIFNDAGDERKRAFVNGHEASILLDFNVDGVIYNKI